MYALLGELFSKSIMSNVNYPFVGTKQSFFVTQIALTLSGVSQVQEPKPPMTEQERGAVSPYLNRPLRSIEEAAEDVRRVRDRLAELDRLTLKPTAEIIPFPQD